MFRLDTNHDQRSLFERTEWMDKRVWAKSEIGALSMKIGDSWVWVFDW